MELKEKVKAGIGKAVTYWKQYGAEAALWADLIAVAVLYAMMTAHVPTQNGDNIEHIHSSFLIAQGQVPYRDFFQLHRPVLPLSSPLMARTARSTSAAVALSICTMLVPSE